MHWGREDGTVEGRFGRLGGGGGTGGRGGEEGGYLTLGRVAGGAGKGALGSRGGHFVQLRAPGGGKLCALIVFRREMVWFGGWLVAIVNALSRFKWERGELGVRKED